MENIEIKRVQSFIGDCLVITDNHTNKTVEIMSLQLLHAIGSSGGTGSLPHGGWDKNNEFITVYHDDDRENHEVTLSIKELKEGF